MTKFTKVARSLINDKHLRYDSFAKIKEEFTTAYSEGKEAAEVNKTLIGKYYHDVEKEAMRRMILDEGVRPRRAFNNRNSRYLGRSRLPSGISRIIHFHPR